MNPSPHKELIPGWIYSQKPSEDLFPQQTGVINNERARQASAGGQGRRAGRRLALLVRCLGRLLSRPVVLRLHGREEQHLLLGREDGETSEHAVCLDNIARDTLTATNHQQV